MTARRNESVCGVIRAGKGTVRQHIAVEVIRYILTAKNYKSVVRIIRKAAIRCIGNIARGVVRIGFGGQDNIGDCVLLRPCGYSTEAIISITEFDVSVKTLFFDNSRQVIVGILKSRNDRTVCRFFHRRRDSLFVVVNRGGNTSVWLNYANHSVVFVIRIACYTVYPVGDAFPLSSALY